MEFEGKPMIESGALCAFLADRFPEKRFAPQLDSPLRAEYQQWMYFAASTLDPFQTRIMIIEDIPAGELYSQKFSQLIEEVGDAMETLNIALARSEFMCGQTFTAADICVSYHLFWLKLWPEFLSVMDKYPRVLSYLDRMTARPAASKSEVFSYEV
jgi:glutathione S-transferase